MKNDGIKIILHRGSAQIGGVCTELSTKNTRIIFDLGAPLEGEGNQERLVICGVTNGPLDCDAVFLTHYHGDHVGEIPDLLPGIPIFMGQAAREILIAQQAHKKSLGEPQWAGKTIGMKSDCPVTIGDFLVTPILSDHSAYDSLMYLIEAEGKRILLTGDFRLHGLYTEGLKAQPGKISPIDLLIAEGTNLTRDNGIWHDEGWVQKEFEKVLSSYKYVFLLASSSNLDRIAEFASVVPRGKYMLMDLYQQNLMEIRNRYCQEKFQVERITWFSEKTFKKLEERIEKRGFGMAVRTGERFLSKVKYFSEKYPEKTCLIYSMWNGYKELPGVSEMLKICPNVKTLHVTGHVTQDDLKQMVKILSPGKVIINHTSASAAEEDEMEFSNLIHLRDEEALILY